MQQGFSISTMKRRAYSILVLSLVVSCGCQEGTSVEGRVTVDGAPLEGVHVAFFPEGRSVNDPTLFRGVTDADGRYTLRNPVENKTGAPAGRYRVSLTTAVAGPNDDETTPLPPERVPAKFRNQKYEVPEGGTNQANFDLKSR
jgi:hypothetical protein